VPKRLPSVLISAAAGVACLALATPAWAATGSGNDPKGANGTVKIDGVPLDNGVDNEPHVGCEFAVNFFGFDKGERANIVFTLHKPSGKGPELLRRNDVLGSDDPAGGAKPDQDKTFTFSASDLGLSAPPEDKQGYHVKLTVELPGTPGGGKHKVFWLKPCAPSESPSTPPGGGENGGGGGSNGSGESGGAAGGGGLPVTGTAVGSIALLGGAMVAGGAALLLIRRRRDITGAG
jgi:LPXTG-motif cell wall-anchored protein